MSDVIIYPIFEECKKFTLDESWREIFDGCSRNRFPKGMKYDPKQSVFFVKKDPSKKTEIFSASLDDPKNVFMVCMKIFKEELGMRSKRDIQLSSEELYTLKEKYYVDPSVEWKQIRQKYVKDRLVLEYVYTLKDKYSLTDKEVKKLLSTIQLGFRFRTLTQSDVVFEEGKIISIDNIVFDEDHREFTCISEPRHIRSTDKSKHVPTKYLSFIDKITKEYKTRLQ